MTVINGIEIDNIHYQPNEIKAAIRNNAPIEEKLNVIIVISNPCLYARRYILLREFVKRIEEEEHIRLFIVEMIYPGQNFIVTDQKNPHHLQLKTEVPIWHKENMINLGVRYLLPKDYKAFAWVDADLEFDSPSWALDTLKVLNGHKDVVQIFSHCVDMDRDETTLNIFHGFGYSFCKNKKYHTKTLKDFWHPGYAWAITREAYEKIGGIYQDSILGSGDNIMALSFIQKCNTVCNPDYSSDFRESMLDFQKKVEGLRLGYIPGVIRHHYHGTKENRRYMDRWKILVKHGYSPVTHITYDPSGILIPTELFSSEFRADIFRYFLERKEDE